MSTRYYFSWFYGFLPEKLVRSLHEDIQGRKSLVLISAQPSDYAGDQVDYADISELTWLTQADLIFEECHFIDYRTQKEEAARLIAEASVVFLCGGDPVRQHDFLAEYDLPGAIQKSEAVIMAASAGSLNLSAAWLRTEDPEDEAAAQTLYEGIGLDRFAYETHAKRDHATFAQGYLFPLSEKIGIYAAEQESAIRVKNGKIDVLGSVYFISRSNIQKLSETL
ncbi:Type 1 glutamine amidotransferase-like domain-containing protein [Saccharibacillus sacchari]|uniref:Type 1 glutamine amidotransferase-like domain-containing protein n=1 Tax=Saccharibacillus sacchari TaxID=456493 RepID=A0ACC6PFI7_9BACL